MRDERAVSSTISYVLTLAISALLVSGLLIAGSDFVNDRREQVVRNELRVVGQQVAADLERADRLVQAAEGSTTVELERTFPNDVSGSQYRIRIETDASSGPDRIALSSADPEIRVEITFRVATDLDDTTVADGGVIQISYDQSATELVIADA